MAYSRACSALLFSVALLVSACSSHVYVSRSQGEQIRDVELPSGDLELIPDAGTSVVVGVAYSAPRDRLYLRRARGTQIQEIQRSTGRVVRTFSTRPAIAGCGSGGAGVATEQPTIGCGLAIRWRDTHLFLDHPVGNVITEFDPAGNKVRDIRLSGGSSVIGGLAYDQRKNTIYVLYAGLLHATVVEVDLDGKELSRIQLTPNAHPEGLSISPDGTRLYVPLVGGLHIGIFDLSGRLVGRHALGGAGGGIAGGVGAGPRRVFR